MPRARIGLRERSQAIILLYRLPAPLLHPLAVLYALVGGAAVGIGTGMALIVAGVIGPHTGPWALRLVMVGASVVGAALLYGLVYLPGARGVGLRARFDAARRTVTLWPPPQHEPLSLDALDVLGFRLDMPQADEDDRPCTLLADVDRASPVILLRLDISCDDTEADMTRLAGLLNSELVRLKPRVVRAGAIPPGSGGPSHDAG